MVDQFHFAAKRQLALHALPFPFFYIGLRRVIIIISSMRQQMSLQIIGPCKTSIANLTHDIVLLLATVSGRIRMNGCNVSPQVGEPTEHAGADTTPKSVVLMEWTMHLYEQYIYILQLRVVYMIVGNLPLAHL